jgi:hypothetical protein
VTAPYAVHLGTGNGPRCGHPHAVCLDGVEAAVTCLDCLSLIAGTYHAGSRWHWADVKPCGTTAAYRRHLRHGERACESCLQAERRDWQDRSAS